MIRLLPGVIVFLLWAYCLVDAIVSDQSRVRHLPKWVWIVLVLLFPLVGSVAWLVAGRPGTPARLTRERGAAPGFPEYERPGRMAASDPAKDEEFLRQVRERAEEQRRRYEAERRRKAELEGDGEGTPEA
ncbi:PLD nuclease N-terminal domain-containing protein [Nocardioides sp. SOB77]|uniref:PLD nuclease N-terminal domain-containing protein n=1 Tax=Nocardioides oceani TaxID=3058369 RepID=A0ABT8FKT0_9ACTN|nr:PLD nuclease N-terminal domain-containing protein [Nocardioides oceani]MDN4175296.1 PLD nuclease N-terminal domain-containing protein [Nocardioides oceani]